MEENTDEMERLKEIVEERGGEDTFNNGGNGGLKRRIEGLEAENTDLHTKLTSQTLAQTLNEKEDLADEIKFSPPRHPRAPPPTRRRVRRAISIQGSDIKEREEREAVEDGLNSWLAALTIELQQRDEEVEMKEREIEELVGEHDRIVEVVERVWTS